MASIKIRLSDKDKMEFELLEDAKKGDTICLKELDHINFDEFYRVLESKKDEKVKEIIQKEKVNWTNEFKNSLEYQNLVNEKNQFKMEAQSLKNNQETIKSNIELIIRNELTQRYSNQLNQLQLEKSNLENEVRNSQMILSNKLNEQKMENDKKIQETVHEYELKINNIRNERSKISSKVFGNELEQWISDQYENSMGMLSDCSLKKITKANDSDSMADFFFEVKDLDTKATIQTVTIEAKTESHVAASSKKNENHYAKLDKDRKNKNSKYALLISELEPESDKLIYKVKEYEDMFVVRPQYFVTFLSLIRVLCLKEKEIQKNIVEFRDKTEIINEFEGLKREILENSLKNMGKQLSEILKEGENIQKAAAKIIKAASVVLDTHVESFKNKIERFKINKIVKHIEKHEEEKNNQ